MTFDADGAVSMENLAFSGRSPAQHRDRWGGEHGKFQVASCALLAQLGLAVVRFHAIVTHTSTDLHPVKMCESEGK